MQFLLSTGILLSAVLQAATAVNVPLMARQANPANPFPACKLVGNFIGPSCPGTLTTVEGAGTIEKCSQECRKNPLCKSFHIWQTQDSPCWLYKGGAEECKGGLHKEHPGWFFDAECYNGTCPPSPPPTPPTPPPSAPECPNMRGNPACNCVCLKRSDPLAIVPAPCQSLNKKGCGCGQIEQGLWGYCQA